MKSIPMKKYFIFCLTFTFFACNVENKDVGSASDENQSKLVNLSEDQFALADIQTSFLEKKLFSETLTCSGNIEPTPNGYAMLTAPMGGFVKSINLFIGEKVSKNDVLITLENPEFIELQEEYMVAESQLEYLENEYERKKALFEEKAVSEKDFLQSKSEFLMVKAMFRSSKAKLKMLNLDPDSINKSEISSQISIKSPINGYVAKIHGNVGKFFNETEVIIEIVNPDNNHLHLKVFEKDISLVKKGQSVIFSSLSEPLKKYEGEIYSLGHSINNEDHTITTHASIRNKDSNLIPGIFVNADIKIKEFESYSIPFEGLIKGADKDYIFLVSDSAYIKQEVQTGKEQDGFISIIQPGENIINSKVVVKGAYFINAALEGSEEE